MQPLSVKPRIGFCPSCQARIILMVGRFSQQAPSFSLLAQGRKSFHWLCCLPGWAFGHLSFRFFHSHYLHFQIYSSTWQYKPILSNGALRAFTFPCSRWKVPARHQGLGAICRFQQSSQFWVEGPTLAQCLPGGEWVRGGSFSGQCPAQLQAAKHWWQLCLQPVRDLWPSSPRLPLEHHRRNQDGSRVVMGIWMRRKGKPRND